MNRFFHKSSSAQPLTLTQIGNQFDHTKVKLKVLDNMKDVKNLLKVNKVIIINPDKIKIF